VRQDQNRAKGKGQLFTNRGFLAIRGIGHLDSAGVSGFYLFSICQRAHREVFASSEFRLTFGLTMLLKDIFGSAPRD
jgi:hypothetical protein